MTTSAQAAGFDPVAEIVEHSEGLARAAEGNLAAPVEHCPGWTVADLVWHVTEVHRFWARMVTELPSEPPGDGRGPDRPADELLVAGFRAGAGHLARVLAEADPAAACWTWARAQQDVGFVVRHQVQEAAVHHWDAEHAAGRSLALGAAVSADAVAEFLTFSVATVAGFQQEPPRPGLGGPLVLAATDAGVEWTVTDDQLPGTVRFAAGPVGSAPADAPRVAGTASDLLLWLYGRVPLPVTAGPAGQPAAEQLVARFRALAFTG